MVSRFLFAGFGGQGVLMMGQLLSQQAMLSGKEVSYMPSYGPEMRGGTANCTVIVSDEPIASPVADGLDVLVAMNGSSLEKFGPLVVSGGLIFVNSGMVSEKIERKDLKAYYVDCKKIAQTSLGNEKAANVVMLGAILKGTGIVPLEGMEKVFEEVFSGKGRNMVDLNLKALSLWEENS